MEREKKLNRSIVCSFQPDLTVQSIQLQKKRKTLEEGDHGSLLLDTVDTVLLFQLPPLLYMLIHKGNCCIHICLDCATLPGDGEILVIGGRRAEEIMGGEGLEGFCSCFE